MPGSVDLLGRALIFLGSYLDPETRASFRYRVFSPNVEPFSDSDTSFGNRDSMEQAAATDRVTGFSGLFRGYKPNHSLTRRQLKLPCACAVCGETLLMFNVNEPGTCLPERIHVF